MNEDLKRALAKYGDNPPRFLWKHLPRAEQERLVTKSIKRELKFLGLDTAHVTDEYLLAAIAMIPGVVRRRAHERERDA